MAIVSLFGLTSTNPLVHFRRVTLAHPSVAHSLLLASFPGDSGYRSTLRSFKASDGRSLTGSIRLQGGGFKPPNEWEISAIGNKPMRDLLEILLLTQQTSTTPISLIDEYERALFLDGASNPINWLSGYPVTGPLGYPEGFAAYNVHLDVGSDWWEYRGGGRFALQFSAVEVLG